MSAAPGDGAATFVRGGVLESEIMTVTVRLCPGPTSGDSGMIELGWMVIPGGVSTNDRNPTGPVVRFVKVNV